MPGSLVWLMSYVLVCKRLNNVKKMSRSLFVTIRHSPLAAEIDFLSCYCTMAGYFCEDVENELCLMMEIQQEIATNPVTFAAEMSKFYPKNFTASYMAKFNSWCKGADAAADIVQFMSGFAKTSDVLTALDNSGFVRVAQKLRETLQPSIRH